MIKVSLGAITSLSAFIPLIVLLLKQFRTQNKFVPLSVYVVLAALTEVLLITAGGMNLHYMNAFACVSFILIGWIYFRLINNRRIKQAITVFAPLLFCFGLINMFYFQGLYYVNSYTFMIQVIFVTLLSGILIFQCYNSIQAGQNPIKEPVLITALIFLFYYGISFFAFAYAFEAVRFNSDFPIKVWEIHAVINILFNLFLAYLVWITTSNKILNE